MDWKRFEGTYEGFYSRHICLQIIHVFFTLRCGCLQLKALFPAMWYGASMPTWISAILYA